MSQQTPAHLVAELVRDWRTGVKSSNEICIALAHALEHGDREATTQGPPMAEENRLNLDELEAEYIPAPRPHCRLCGFMHVDSGDARVISLIQRCRELEASETSAINIGARLAQIAARPGRLSEGATLSEALDWIAQALDERDALLAGGRQ
ncbi:hypothetical protein [Geopseudomonas aromaticivorans]